MHLTGRALTLIALAAALGIASLWTEAASLRDLWLVPIVLLAAGLAFESARVARLRLAMRLRPPAAVLLGQACEFHLELSADQSVAIEWLLSPPVQLEGEIAVQALRLRADRANDERHLRLRLRRKPSPSLVRAPRSLGKQPLHRAPRPVALRHGLGRRELSRERVRREARPRLGRRALLPRLSASRARRAQGRSSLRGPGATRKCRSSPNVSSSMPAA